MKTLVVLLLLASTAAADDSSPPPTAPLVPAALPPKICNAVREETPALAFAKQVTPLRIDEVSLPAIPLRVTTTSIRIAMKF